MPQPKQMIKTGGYPFTGGGEMGELIRSKDWGQTPLGDPMNWPVALRTMVSVMLDNPFGMYIAWGDEFTQIYNDGYRPILGISKHPQALGISTRETFSEVWHIIGPMFDKVMKGIPVGFPDFMLPLERNGFVEECFFDFAYSPIRNEDGEVGGVLVTVIETTDRKKVVEELKEREDQLQFAIEAAELATFDYNPITDRLSSNKRLKEWFDLPANGIVNLGDALKLVAENDRAKTFNAIQKSLEYTSGGNYDVEYSIVNPVTKKERILHAKGRVWFNDDKIAYRLNGTLEDVTEKTTARRELEQSEQNIRALVESAPFPIAVYEGEEMKIILANQSVMDAWGKGNDVIGKLYSDILPEFENQKIFEQVKAVYSTGVPFHAKNQRVDLVKGGVLGTYFYNYSFTPLYDASGKIYGVLNTAAEVTELNRAKQQVERSEKRFRNSVKQAPLGITIFRGPDFITELANDAYLSLIDRTAEEFIGHPLFEVIPEVRETVEPLFNEVMRTGEPFYGNEFEIPLKRMGKMGKAYFNFVYQPLREESGELSGIMVVAMEVTSTVLARQSLEESEKHFRNMIMQSPIPMTTLKGKDFIIESANNVMLKKIWRRTPNAVLGKSILEAFPELNDQKYPELLNKVFNTGEKYNEDESVAFVEGDDGMRRFFLDFEYAPLLDPDHTVSGITITVNDVTERVEDRLKLEEAEERLRLATEPIGISTWVLDLLNGKLIHSPRLAVIFGHEESEIIQHSDLRSQIHPDDIHAVVEKSFDEALETGTYKYEARIIKPDKTISWIRTSAKVFYDEKKKPVKMYGTTQDITEEKHYQQVLKESEAKFRALADSIPQQVWTADPDGNMFYYNQTVYDYSGYDPEQLQNDGWLQIIHPDDREANISTWKNSLATGEDFLFEHRFRRSDGEYRWQLSRAIPQRDETGKIKMWVGSSTDIQNIKQQEQQKDYFISVASHELKTPLTSIKGYVQMLQMMHEKYKDPFLQNALKIINKQIDTLTKLISELLDVSKIKSSGLDYDIREFELTALVDEIVDEIKHIHPDYKVEIDLPGPVNVLADRDRIGQVLINFLTNAVKYSPNSNLIEITGELAGPSVTISVRDYGIGINKNDQEKVFERFYRVEGKNEKTFPGFGIGLYISSEIIKKHNGKIRVNSEPGKGSVFSFTLPVYNEKI